MKDFNLKKYLAEGKLLKEGFSVSENPFKGDFEGTFLSNDGGITGLFITTDPNFDSGDYETLGDEAVVDLNGMDVRIISVYG